MSASKLYRAKTENNLILSPPAVALSRSAGGFRSRQRRAAYQWAESRAGRWATSSTWEGLHWFLRATETKQHHVR